jgi:hypothetical protein
LRIHEGALEGVDEEWEDGIGRDDAGEKVQEVILE